MSSVVQEPRAASAATHSAFAATISTILARRGVLIAAATRGALVAIGVGLLLATSDHLVDPIAFGIQRAVIIVGWSSAALYWLVRRPGNRLGLAFVARAVATAVISLQGASNPLLHSIGVLDDFPAFLLAYYVVFAFPEGRLAGWPERLLLAGWALWFLTSFFPYLLFSPVVTGGSPLAGCNAACPKNAFMIADRPTIADGFGSDIVVPGDRGRSGDSRCLVLPPGDGNSTAQARAHSRLRTRRDAHGARPDLPRRPHRLISIWIRARRWDIGWFLSVGRTLLPYGFLLSVVVSTFFAATALKMIVSRLVENPSASQLRTTLADALDDPSLELGFRLEQGDGFVDSSGVPSHFHASGRPVVDPGHAERRNRGRDHARRRSGHRPRARRSRGSGAAAGASRTVA